MLEDPPLLTIRRTRPDPDAALLAGLAGVQTGQAVDAMGGRGALCGLRPLDPARAAFAGFALPCEPGPDDNLAILAALALARPGEVIVAAAGGFGGSAVIGDNVAMVARARGLAAVVVDGMARDLAGIRDVGLPVHALGVTPNSCVRSGPGRVGLPVVAGGVAVAAGDLVLGDADGVVVVPRGEAAAVLARIAAVQAAERSIQARIREGFTDLGGLEALLASPRVRWIG